jgi:hypothetical protein
MSDPTKQPRQPRSTPPEPLEEEEAIPAEVLDEEEEAIPAEVLDQEEEEDIPADVFEEVEEEAVPAETLEEAIARVRGERSEALAAKEAGDAAFADADGRLTVLEKLQSDIDKAKAAYEAAHDQLTIEQQAYDDYYDSEQESLTEILGHLTGTVDRWHADTRTELAAAERAVTSAKDRVEQAETNRKDADADRQVEATAVTELQQLVATIQTRHGQLRSIRDAVNKAHQEGHYALAYWLLKHGRYGELLNGKPALIDPDDLPAHLLAAVNELGDASKALALADAAVTKRRGELIAAEAHLADRKAKGEAELRVRLTQIVPTEA